MALETPVSVSEEPQELEGIRNVYFAFPEFTSM